MKKKILLAVPVFIFCMAGLSFSDGLSVEISGFVDTSYSDTSSSDISTFSLDQVEVDLKKEVKGVGTVRADLNYSTLTSPTSTDDVLEQGFVTIEKFPVTVMVGKFNAPIGFELLDAPEMYQFSHAMVFDFGLPSNLTGINFSGGFSMFDVNVYYVNGWDLISDDNKEKTVGGRLGLDLGEVAHLGVSYISGKEGADTALADPLSLNVFDVDLTITPFSRLTFGAEFNSGVHKGMSAVKPGDNAEWTAYLFMGHYDFNDEFGFTIRYDAFDDKDGARLGGMVKEKRNSYTVASTFSVGEGFAGLIEYRRTTSDQNVFTDSSGAPEDSGSSLAAELTYTF
ncbi:MAG: outer membrane beta-barrel protein [Nitrospinota bacterium]